MLRHRTVGVGSCGSTATSPTATATSPTGTPDDPQDTSVVRWHCQSWESNDATNPTFSATIPECEAPDRVRMDIFFPSCWNGVDLDSEDHKSHMAYPIKDDSGTVVCPDSHPVPIVRPSYHYAFNGWHPSVIEAILETCIQDRLDCHDGNLGNGFRLPDVFEGAQNDPEVINDGLGAMGGHDNSSPDDHTDMVGRISTSASGPAVRQRSNQLPLSIGVRSSPPPYW